MKMTSQKVNKNQTFMNENLKLLIRGRSSNLITNISLKVLKIPIKNKDSVDNFLG